MELLAAMQIRPAPMLARTVTSLSALSGGRVVLGMGAGGAWDEITRLGVPRRTPAEAVRAFAETITVVRLLSGGGAPVTFDGESPVVDEAAVAAGRSPTDVATVFNLPGRITSAPLAATRSGGRWVGGSVSQWVEELTGAVLTHDAGGFTYFPVDSADVALGRWAQEVVPAVREAVMIKSPLI